MGDSLSIIVPVPNAEDSLRGNVIRLLDMLPELTSRFEIVIVDENSSDQTEEVAHDLAREFPQVRIVRDAGKQGANASIEHGLSQSDNDVVFVREASSAVRESVLTGRLRVAGAL